MPRARCGSARDSRRNTKSRHQTHPRTTPRPAGVGRRLGLTPPPVGRAAPAVLRSAGRGGGTSSHRKCRREYGYSCTSYGHRLPSRDAYESTGAICSWQGRLMLLSAVRRSTPHLVRRRSAPTRASVLVSLLGGSCHLERSGRPRRRQSFVRLTAGAIRAVWVRSPHQVGWGPARQRVRAGQRTVPSHCQSARRGRPGSGMRPVHHSRVSDGVCPDGASGKRRARAAVLRSSGGAQGRSRTRVMS